VERNTTAIQATDEKASTVASQPAAHEPAPDHHQPG
jgi:hypothetical protein